MSSSRTATASAKPQSATACCRFSHLHPDRPRRERRYPSDMSDAEWALTEPLLPAPACTTYWGGGRETHCRRQVVDAIRYLVDNGVKWRALPADFPCWPVVYRYFRRFGAASTRNQLACTHSLALPVYSLTAAAPRRNFLRMSML